LLDAFLAVEKKGRKRALPEKEEETGQSPFTGKGKKGNYPVKEKGESILNLACAGGRGEGKNSR